MNFYRKTVIRFKSLLPVTKNDLKEMEQRIMSQLSEVEADLAEIKSAAEGISNGVKALDKQIADFQNSPGTLSPSDQATLDRIQASSKALVQLTKAIQLDAETPGSPSEPTPQ